MSNSPPRVNMRRKVSNQLAQAEQWSAGQQDSALNRIGWEFMECHVCASRYRKPKLLDCLHSVCEECLVSNTPSSAKDVTCPECQQTTAIPNGGIRNLPSNKFMSALVQESLIQEQMSGGGKDRVCDSCNSGSKPSTRCMDCEAFMCSNCTDIHRKDRRNSKHRTSTLGELRNGGFRDQYSATSTPSCETHPAESAAWYCITCDVSVCKDCTLFHHRAPKHKIVKDTRETARERRGVIDKMLVIVEKRTEEFERAQELVQGTEKGIHARLHRAKKAIGQEADEKIEIIKKERNYELSQLTTKMTEGDSSRRIERSPLLKMHQAKDEINAAADVKLVKLEEQRAGLLNKIASLEEDRGRDLQEAMINVHGLTQRAKYSYTLAMILLKEAGDHHFLSLYIMLGKALKALIKTKPSDVDQRLEIVSYSKSESAATLGTLSDTIASWFLVKTYGKRDSDDFKTALGIASCPNGDIVLADEGHKRVVIFGLDGEFKQKLSEPKKSRGEDNAHPCGVAVNSLGHFIVVDMTKFVKVYDGNGKYLDEFEIDNRRGQACKGVCVAVDSKDRILIGDKSRSVLTIHTPDGSLIERVELNLRPWFLAVNSRDEIIISDFEAGRIVAIDYSGRVQFTMETIVDGDRIKAAGVCCDSNDDIFVSLHSGDEKGTYPICQFNPRGKFLGCVARGLYNPLGLTFTKDGKLAVADTSSVKLYRM